MRKLLLLAASFWLVSGATTRAAEPKVTAVESVGIVVSDLERSVRFYTEVLGFKKRGQAEESGDDFLEYLAQSNGRAKPPDTRADDLIQWQTRLRVTSEAAAASKKRTELIADPDGHVLRLAP